MILFVGDRPSSIIKPGAKPFEGARTTRKTFMTREELAEEYFSKKLGDQIDSQNDLQEAFFAGFDAAKAEMNQEIKRLKWIAKNSFGDIKLEASKALTSQSEAE